MSGQMIAGTTNGNYANTTGHPIEREIGMAAPMPPANKIRDIHITPMSHGYVVTVGCQNFAIEKASDLIAKLSEYILNPIATEKKWDEGKLF